MPMSDPDQQLAKEASKQHIASIKAVPRMFLPHGPARTRLLDLAKSGADVYCYQSGGPSGAWCVWLVDERETIGDYLAKFAQRVGEQAGSGDGEVA